MDDRKSDCRSRVCCLFPEILAIIFQYLSIRDKGRVAQVCKLWKEVAYRKSVWRGVQAKLHVKKSSTSLFASLVQRGIASVQILSLSRPLKEVVKEITTLKELDISGSLNVNDIVLKRTFIESYDCLASIDLSLCKLISDEGIKRVALSLRNLSTLNLAGCSGISNSSMFYIASRLKNLQELNLRSCRNVSDNGIAFLCGINEVHRKCFERLLKACGIPESSLDLGLDKLRSLTLQDCQQITDKSLQHISESMHVLVYLNISFCNGITDVGMQHLSKITMVEELCMQHCDEVTDVGICQLFKGASRMRLLDISFCERVGDRGLSFIALNFTNLEELSINSCNISNCNAIKLVNNLHKLKILNIAQISTLTDEFLFEISRNLTSLTSIDLYGCSNITSTGVQYLYQLPKLQGNINFCLTCPFGKGMEGTEYFPVPKRMRIH